MISSRSSMWWPPRPGSGGVEGVPSRGSGHADEGDPAGAVAGDVDDQVEPAAEDRTERLHLRRDVRADVQHLVELHVRGAVDVVERGADVEDLVEVLLDVLV